MAPTTEAPSTTVPLMGGGHAHIVWDLRTTFAAPLAVVLAALLAAFLALVRYYLSFPIKGLVKACWEYHAAVQIAAWHCGVAHYINTILRFLVPSPDAPVDALPSASSGLAAESVSSCMHADGWKVWALDVQCRTLLMTAAQALHIPRRLRDVASLTQVPGAAGDGCARGPVLHVLHPRRHHDLRWLRLPHDLPAVRGCLKPYSFPSPCPVPSQAIADNGGAHPACR